MENVFMIMLGFILKVGFFGVDELVEVLEELLVLFDDLIFSDN